MDGDRFTLRPQQQEITDHLLERTRSGDREPVVGLLAPGYGKEYAWQHAATALMREGHIDASLTQVPRVNLSEQAESNWWWQDKKGHEHGLRLRYANPAPHSFRASDGNQTPLVPSPAFGYIPTYQAGTTRPELHIAWAEEHHEGFLLVLDEAAVLGTYGLGDRDETPTKAAMLIQRLYPHAAATLVLTGTPYRYDGKRLVLLEHRYHDGLLDAEVTGTYRQGVAAGFLRPCEAVFVDGEGERVLPDGSEITTAVESDPGLIAPLLRTPRVYESITRHVIDKLVSERRLHNGAKLVAGLACMDQDHARAINDYAASYAPHLRMGIAVYKDGPAARRVLRAAVNGDVDVLIFVRMAFIGFNCPQMSVMGLLTNWRQEGFLGQTTGRGLRIWPELPTNAQRAYFFTLNDPSSVRFFENLQRDAQQGLRERKESTGGGFNEPRLYRNMRATGVHVGDEEGEVEQGGQVLKLMERHGVGGPVRPIANLLREQYGHIPNLDEEEEPREPEGEPTTRDDRVKLDKRRAQTNLRQIAREWIDGGRCEGFEAAMRQLNRDLSHRAGAWSDGKLSEEQARGRVLESRTMCEEQGVIWVA